MKSRIALALSLSLWAVVEFQRKEEGYTGIDRRETARSVIERTKELQEIQLLKQADLSIYLPLANNKTSERDECRRMEGFLKTTQFILVKSKMKPKCSQKRIWWLLRKNKCNLKDPAVRLCVMEYKKLMDQTEHTKAQKVLQQVLSMD